MVKKIAFVLAGALLFLGCADKQQKKEVERAAYGYLDAMGNYRINDAAEFSSSGTRETTIKVFNRMMGICDSAKLMENTPAEITITGVRILDDTTARAYFHKHTPITEQTDSVKLILEDGHWLVDVRIKAPDFLDTVLPIPNIDSIRMERERFISARIRGTRTPADEK